MLVVKDDDGAFAGFLTFWEWDDFVYGEHFAVEGVKCVFEILEIGTEGELFPIRPGFPRLFTDAGM